MPEPVRDDQKYLPGLDGLRALAVAAVIAYHLGYGWAQGGLLGVGVFFTLSGYLITGILLGHWEKAGRLGLRDFWLRRARRLLPALFVMLVAVAIWVNIGARAYLPGLRGDVVASALYVSNWWYIGQHASYYAQFSPPAPLDHLWSLAVEEQFYLLWPWLLLGALWLVSRKWRGGRGWLATRGALAGVTIVLAAASAIEMAMLYHPGYDPTRAYEGTDTRAFGLLAGAALAIMWPARRGARPRLASAVTLDLAGAAGLAGIAVLIWRTTEYTSFMFRGGLVLLSLATVALVAAAATPGSVTGRALGCGPLRWLGVRSYGIYLWHYPIIVLTAPPFGAAFGLPRATAVVAATVAAAAVSWAFVEEPVRRGRLPRAPRLTWPRGVPRPAWPRGVLVPALAVGCTCLGVLAAVTVTRLAAHGQTTTATARMQPTVPAAARPATHDPPARATHTAAPKTVIPGRTSCRSVVHIGDSTSEGLDSPDYLPNPAQRITARYAAAGVAHQNMQISGGRSIVERLPGQQNAYTVAKRIIASGYRGCWVLALGTDDTADVAAGSRVGLAQRIGRMMSVIGNQPVLWVNVKTLLSSGPYSERNMLAWNRALVAALPRYPNMRIYDWAAVVRNAWFIRDGIHYSSDGYRHRAQMIADALATAFPAVSSAPTAAPSASAASSPPAASPAVAASPARQGGRGRS
jgi:peptidoglycan/LPS O-acetylase OafA/YrhL